MTPDWLLLRRYAQDNSQEAFAALTARYLNLVYTVCLREVHDPELAQDVTQAVFLVLARTAPSFRSKTALPGWLFQTARFASQNARTRERRRRQYEEKAAMEKHPQANTEASAWAEIEPLLNTGLARLKSADRDCLLLRFFQGLSFAEVGSSLGVSEDAARKRVTRSLDKMRQFFTKNGVIVPAIALPVLLTVHAAKAAPAACQANIAQLTTSVFAGHTTAALTGSHAYQLSQGAMNAMKIAQIKIVVGFTAGAVAAVAGLAAYTSATGFARPMSPPGHILVQTASSKLTASQIATRCLEAYSALKTYQGTTTVTEQSAGASIPIEMHSSATIQFAQPGKIHAEGRDSNFIPWVYTSDGIETMEKNNFGGWKKVKNTELAIGTVTGVSLQAGTTVPAVLLNSVGTKRGYPLWGTPLALEKQVDAEIREDSIEGRLCYVLTAHLTTPTLSQTEYLWIDEKTFLLRRLVSDRQNQNQTITPNNTPHFLPASRAHIDEKFTNERINQPIPGSTFALPAVQ